MKKINKILISAGLLLTLNTPGVLAASEPPTASAKGVVVLNAQTGEVLYDKNKDTAYAPASPTKLMTALLTLENCNLDEKVTVGEVPPTIEGSKIYIDTGEILTVRELLYSLIMVSANDCAAALAEHMGGNIEGFAKMMNDRAKKLGCKNTNFTNPHGLYEANHKTTAYDLALIENELLKNPTYLEISKTKSMLLQPTNKFKEKRPLWNDNRLVQSGDDYYYKYCLAGKTGYTDEALHSYVGSARKDNETFVVAFLRDQDKTYFGDSRNFFDWAFNNFETVKCFTKNSEVTNYTTSDGTKIPILASNDAYYTKDKTLNEEPVISYDINKIDKCTILSGQTIGTATFKYNNKEKKVDLISGIDYEPKNSNFLTKIFKSNSKMLNIGLILVGIFSCLLILTFIIIRKKKKKYKKNYFKR